MKIKISADSTCDLSKELVEKYHDSDSDKELKNEIMTYLLEKYKPLVLKLTNRSRSQ